MTALVVALGLPLALPIGSEGPQQPLRQVKLELVADGFERPTGLIPATDGSGRLFVLEQAGRVQAFVEGDAERSVILDLSDRVTTGTEQGLLGLALHPDYGANGRMYVNYTDLQGDTVIAEYAPGEGPGGPLVERRLLVIDQPHEFHNGGGLAFGPDGYMYIGVGDGGWPNDVIGSGQDTSSLFGTILRVDVDPEGSAPYGIPADNPFAHGGGRPEIWDYGLRNPWRFAFDSASGDLFIADVGQLSYEEINRHPAGVPGGMNFGWSVMEGSRCFDAPTCESEGMVPPLVEYGGRRLKTGNCAIIGGPVHRGGIEVLAGRLLFADFCSGRIWTLLVDAPGTVPEEQLDTELVISSLDEDAHGNPLVIDYAGGAAYRIVVAAADSDR